jgi:hypothetical protein
MLAAIHPDDLAAQGAAAYSPCCQVGKWYRKAADQGEAGVHGDTAPVHEKGRALLSPAPRLRMRY